MGQSENSNRGLSKQQLRYRGFRFFSMFNSKSDGFYVSTTPYGDEPKKERREKLNYHIGNSQQQGNKF
ncbi:hypothetical protein [Exiguobacterium sp. E4787]|uniref:hypothetical protein n=1 Tax=Exiguobacterium sp. E4787 TaxID=2751225 RepID=UPI001BE61EFA|nr:hypothetical protein [Exiguobacterium sp. E4787]